MSMTDMPDMGAVLKGDTVQGWQEPMGLRQERRGDEEDHSFVAEAFTLSASGHQGFEQQ